jgi:hypothetical protein
MDTKQVNKSKRNKGNKKRKLVNERCPLKEFFGV